MERTNRVITMNKTSDRARLEWATVRGMVALAGNPGDGVHAVASRLEANAPHGPASIREKPEPELGAMCDAEAAIDCMAPRTPEPLATIRRLRRVFRLHPDDARLVAGVVSLLPPNGEKWLLARSRFTLQVFFSLLRACEGGSDLQHRPIFLVGKLLDQVAAVRSRLYNPRNFECHVLRAWLGDYGKCQVHMWPGDMYPFFAPPFEEDLVGADAEAAGAFKVTQEWMVVPVRDAMYIRGSPASWRRSGKMRYAGPLWNTCIGAVPRSLTSARGGSRRSCLMRTLMIVAGDVEPGDW